MIPNQFFPLTFFLRRPIETFLFVHETRGSHDEGGGENLASCQIVPNFYFPIKKQR